jgi:serine phosphatase RsbU (regulator of sigma subunit)/anti-sigma regulatory factor (Ser/Thr protein kinase)
MLLGIVPLAFLAALLALALVVQARNAAIAAASQHAAEVITENAREQELLSAASRAVVHNLETHGKTGLQALAAAENDLPRSSRDLAELVAGEPRQRARALRLEAFYAFGLHVLRQSAGYVRRNEAAKQSRLENSPGVRDFNARFLALANEFADAERTDLTARLRKLHAQVQADTYVLVAICILAIVCTLVTLLLFGVRITRRLRHLALNAVQLARGGPTTALGGQDEIAQLDVIYHEMTRRIRSAHDRAALLQRALLPQKLPAFPGLRIDASYASSGSGEKSVGGDWYDVFRISEQQIGISLGDVAGHGLGAAALMANARHAIRTVAYLNDDPGAVLAQVNQILCRNLDASLVTAVFATFDLYRGTLRYSIGGHPAPLFVRAGESLRELPGRGFVLGVDPRAAFDTHVEQLDVGSALIFYTDGLIESSGGISEGIGRLSEAIENEYRSGSGNIAQAIEQRMLVRGAPRDDCALLFIGVTALGEDAMRSESLSWEIDARVEQSARRVKRAVLWHLGEIAEESSDLSLSEMILAEMIGNVARHTPGPAKVTLLWQGNTATLQVCDQGPAFDLPHDEAADPLAESGRGIFLMRSISRSFSVKRTDAGNCVTAVLPVRIEPPERVALSRSA